MLRGAFLGRIYPKLGYQYILYSAVLIGPTVPVAQGKKSPLIADSSLEQLHR